MPIGLSPARFCAGLIAPIIPASALLGFMRWTIHFDNNSLGYKSHSAARKLYRNIGALVNKTGANNGTQITLS